MKSKIVSYKGKKHIAVDGKIIDSLSMKSFRPTKNNIGDFYAAGVRVFHVYCSGLTSFYNKRFFLSLSIFRGVV